MPGSWDLSHVPPSIIPENALLWWLGPFEINFGYRHLGAMFSFSSGSGIRLQNGTIRGYDRFVIGTEDKAKTGYQSYQGSQAFLWEEHGALPALGDGWISEISLKDMIFETTPVCVLTGGGFGSGGFDPSNANPGIEKVDIDNVQVTLFGSIDLQAIRFGESTIKNTKISSDTRAATMDGFYSQFPANRWPRATGLSESGSPIQNGYRHCIRFGRLNPGDPSLYYEATNGPIGIIDCQVPFNISDIVPSKSKWGGKYDLHCIDIRSCLNATIRGGRYDNNFDFAFTRNHEYSIDQDRGGGRSLDCETIYAKARVNITNISGQNFGPGEGFFGCKPAMAGSVIDNITIRRGLRAEDIWLQPLLDLMPEVIENGGAILSRPGELPNITRVTLSIGGDVQIGGIDAEAFEMPSSGNPNDIFGLYGNRVVPVNSQVRDVNGAVIFQS